MCGENMSAEDTSRLAKGSPPRVRGKLSCLERAAVEDGITPACAGKTVSSSLPPLRVGDHPRVCGENAKTGVFRLGKAGSPPRVRGKQRRLLHARFYFGITPACAGKTERPVTAMQRPRDHPRVCGENVSASSSLGRHG